MKSINKKIIPIYLGKLDYTSALEKQLEFVQLAKESPHHIYLIGVEHPKVITLGYRASVVEELIDQSQFSVVKTERGGLATIHSEGQLVIYPIINLKENKIGVKDFVCEILISTKKLLQSYNITSNTDKNAVGLFTNTGKIAFCGIQVKNGVSMHGLSLNVFNELELFKNIVACGVKDQCLDSMDHYLKNLSLEKLFKEWVNVFTDSNLMQL